MASPKQANHRKMAREFIANNRSASLATGDEKGNPHLAVVYCIVHEDLTIYFTTRAEGRKFDNLIANSTVAMLFSGYGSLQQLQLSGSVERVSNKKQELDLLHELWKLRYDDPNLPRPQVDLLKPGVRKEYVIFCVRPFEMTYANFQTDNVGRYKPDFIRII